MVDKTRKMRAKTPEQQENILINLATKLAEKKLRDGSASSQLICQVLSLGTEKKRLENEKLKTEVNVANAKIEQMKQTNLIGELYANAISAFQRYSGVDEGEILDESEGGDIY